MLSTFFFDDSQFRVSASTSFVLPVVLSHRRHGGWKPRPGIRSEVRCCAYMPCELSIKFQEMRKQSISGVGSVGFARFLSVSKVSLFEN